MSLPIKRSVSPATAPTNAETLNTRLLIRREISTLKHSISPPTPFTRIFLLWSGSRPSFSKRRGDIAVATSLPVSNLTLPGTSMAFPSPFLIFTGSSSIEITCGLNSEKEKKIETARNYYLNKPYTKLSLKLLKVSLPWKKWKAKTK